MDDEAGCTVPPKSELAGRDTDRIPSRLIPFANGFGSNSSTPSSFHPGFRGENKSSTYLESVDSTDSAIGLSNPAHQKNSICRIQGSCNGEISFHCSSNVPGYFSRDSSQSGPSGLPNGVETKFRAAIPDSGAHRVASGDEFGHYRGSNEETHLMSSGGSRQNSVSGYTDVSGYSSKDNSQLGHLRLPNDIETKFRAAIPDSRAHRAASEDEFGHFRGSNEGTHRRSSGCSSQDSAGGLNVSRHRHGIPEEDAGYSGSQSGSQSSASTMGEDTIDFLRDSGVPALQTRPNFKRKQDDAVEPQKKVKTAGSTREDDEAGISAGDLPPVDVAGHGNLLLIGNQNLTVNFISNEPTAQREASAVSERKCWDWSGTSPKETQVEQVTDVFRRLADNLAQHVDHKKVARNLEFANMASLEDDLNSLRTMKSSEGDRIFFTLLRWWKSNRFGGDRGVIREEVGYLLEDLNLTRMRRNLEQYFK